MAQATWEKTDSSVQGQVGNRGFWRYILLALMIAASGYVVISGTLGSARYFISVDELFLNRAEYAGQTVRVTGAVIGDSIRYDSENLIIEFTVASIPVENDDLGTALYLAVNDPNVTRMQVRVENQVKPELLQHEAQAIMTGTLGEDGIFRVTELNLKCPSRFIENQPDQSIAEPQA